MKKRGVEIILIGLLLLLAGCTSSNPPPTIQGGDESTTETPAPPAATTTPPGQTSGNPTTETQTNIPLSPEETISTTGEFDGLTPNAETSLIFQALNDAGIPDAAVEFQSDNVLMAFNLPSGMSMESTAYFAFGVASKFAQPTQTIWVQVFSGSTTKTYSVKADTVQKYTAGKLNENQLKLAVTVQ